MADGTISIDVDIPVNKVKTDTELIDKALNSIGKGAGKDLDKSFSENADKAKHTATSTAQKIKDVFDRPVKTKLDADDSDVKRKSSEAKEKLDKIPKNKQTELQAKDEASSTMHKVGNEADNTGHKFHKLRDIIRGTFIGTLAAQGVSNALSAIGSKIGGVVKEGMALNAATAGIERRFKGMGLSDTWTKRYMTQIGFLKSRINATGADIANLQTSVSNWSRIGRKGAMQMVTALGAMGDRTNMTSEGYQRLGMSLMRVGSSGKVSLGTLGRIAKIAPSLYHQLAQGAGMSENHMKALLATGKVTTTQFQRWLANSSKNSKAAFNDYAHTQAGATVRMQASWKSLEATMTKPLFNMKTSGLNQMADLMGSKAVQSGAMMIGSGVQKIAKFGLQVLAAISRHKADISGTMTDIVKIGEVLVKDVWKDFAAILGDIAKSFGLIHGNSSKSGSSLHTVRVAMDGLAKNKGAIQMIARAIEIMAIAKLANTANGLLHITSIAKGGALAVVGLAKGFKGVDDASKLTGIEKWGAKLGGVFGKAGSALKDKFLDVWDESLIKISNVKTTMGKFFSSIPGKAKAASKAIQGLFGKGNGAGKLNGLLQSAHSAGGFKNLTTAGKIGTGAAGIGIAVDTATSIVKAIKDKAGSRKQYEDIGTSAGKGIGGAIGLYFGGPAGAAIGAKIGGAVGKWAGDAAKNFQNGWNKKKPPKKFWSLENFGWSTHDMFKKVGKWGQGVAKSFQTGLKKDKSRIKSAWNSVTSSVGKANFAVKKNFNKFSSFLHKSIKKGADKAGKAFKKGWDYMYKHGSKGTKQIMRSTSKFAKNYVKINKRANDETRKNFASFGKRLKRNHGDLFKTIGQTTKEQLKIEKKRWSSNWKNIKSTASEIWKGIKSNAKGFYDDLNKKTHGGLGKVVSGFQSFGKKLASFWSGLFSGIKKTFDNVIGGISKTIGGLGSGIGKFFSGKLKVGSLHLAGGTDWRDRWGTPAILNDGNDSPETGNREGLIHQDGTLELIEGRNVKRWLFPGEDVINAHDMASLFTPVHFARGTRHFRGSSNSNKLTGGSLAKMLKELEKMLSLLKKVKKASSIKLKVKGLTSALKTANKLNKTVKSIGSQSKRSARNIKSIGKTLSNLSSKVRKAYGTVKKYDIGKLLSKETGKAVKSFDGKGNFALAFKRHADKFIDESKSMSKSFHEIWSKMFKDGDKRFKDFVREDLRDLTHFKSSFEKGWRSIDTGVSRIFSKFWSTMHSDSGKGMNRVLSVINSGITQINSVIREFGGSSHSLGRASYVHYANGTGGTLTKPTLAIVNDGNDSPETGNKESWYNHNTGEFGIFEGRNKPILAPAGVDIYKASDTRDFMQSLGYTHFANGTGSSLHYLYELTKKFFKSPKSTLDSKMSTSSIGLAGAMHQLAKGMANMAQKSAENWWKTLWTMVHDKIEGGEAASGLLKAVEELGRGKKYVLGAWGPSAYDCSGLVSRAIQDYYHKGWGRMNVAGLWRHAHRISRSEAKPGDPVFWLPNHHVGIYIGGDRYWSAFAPGAHPDVGVHSIADSVPGVRPTFGRFYGISSTPKENSKVKAKTGLEKLIRKQVWDAGFTKTIQKISDKYGPSLGALALAGDIRKRARILYAAMRRMDSKATRNGIAAILGNWEFESGLNPTATNPSGGATGLGQWLGGRLTNLKAYARRHGKSWRNAGTQLEFALHGDGSDSSIFRRILEGHGSVASLASAFSSQWERGGYTGQHVAGAEKIVRALGFANGGFITRPQVAVVGEGNGAEVVLPYGDPSKRERTLQLMQATIAQMQMQDGMSQKLDANKGTDMTVVNSAIDQINKKFDQALEALGIITAKDDNFTIVSKVDEQTMSAVYRKFKKYDTQNMRRAAKNISGYQTF